MKYRTKQLRKFEDINNISTQYLNEIGKSVNISDVVGNIFDNMQESNATDCLEQLAKVIYEKSGQKRETKRVRCSINYLRLMAEYMKDDDIKAGQEVLKEVFSRKHEEMSKIYHCVTDSNLNKLFEKEDHHDSSIVVHKNTVFLQNGGLRYEIGRSKNIENGYTIRLNPKFFSKDFVLSAKEKAMSCVFPKTKSLSPSMAVHQIAAMMIAMSVTDGASAVSEDLIGNYRNDLTIIKRQERTSIEICGADVDKKFDSLTKDKERENLASIRLMVISKNRIVPCLDHELDYLLYTAVVNDSRDPSFIWGKCYDFCRQYGKKFKVPMSVIEFFMKHVDQMGRSMAKHQSVAEECFLKKAEFYRNRSLLNSFDMTGKEEIIRRKDMYVSSCSKMIDSLIEKRETFIKSKVDKGRKRASVLESDYFIFPNVVSRDEIVDEERFAKRMVDLQDDPLDAEPEFKNGMFQVSGHEEEIEKKNFAKRNNPYYKSIHKIRVIEKPMIALRNYTNNKNLSRLKTMNTYGTIMDILSEYGQMRNYTDALYVGNIMTREDYRIDDKGEVYISISDIDPTAKMVIGQKYDFVAEYDPRSSEKNFDLCCIDPNHEIILAKKGCKMTHAMLLRSRSYQDLRFKARVANAIVNSPKPDRCFEIKHFKDERKKAEVLIRGLLMKKDKGVAYVSYLFEDKIYRCEKWRLPDIEFFIVNHTKLMTVLAGTELRYKKIGMKRDKIQDLLESMCRIFGSILLDNSWGLSKILKPYRYLVHGLVVKSPKVDDSVRKFTDSVRDGDWKHTLHQMLFMFGSNFASLTKKPRLTPLFLLPYEDMCNEIFIINACPSSTFGSKRHLQNCMESVIDEINLYKENEKCVDDMMNYFANDVLTSVDLKKAYSTYIDMIESVSNKTKGRFTNSPLSLVLISKEIDRIFSGKAANPAILQDSQPPLSRYCTAKASSNLDDKPVIAAEAIAELQSIMNTSSTSDLVLRILTRMTKINFSMRMFDKDQVGGDREISIMNSAMRVLVGASEYFFRKVNMSFSNEYLHNRSKVSHFINNSKKSQNAIISILGSVDQTRWGPNHNTCIFGLMALMYCKYNTEAYIASIPCFMGQCKVFEIGLWMDKFVKDVNVKAGNVIGKIGEWHMGQGIYHATSSSFHAVVTNYLLRLMKEEVESQFCHCISIDSSSMVTSDDISFFFTCEDQGIRSDITNEDIELENDKGDKEKIANLEFKRIVNSVRKSMLMEISYYEHVLKFFGIKTSEYKNVYSSKYSEFNSMYSGPQGIVKQDSKFACTLVRPETTGIMIHDYGNAVSTYYNSIESGTSDEMAELIALANYHTFCTHWGLNMSRTGVPSKRSLLTGITPLMKNPVTGNEKYLKDFFIENKCFLRHNMRGFFEKSIERIQNMPNNVQTALSARNLRMICGSRKMEAYKACRTYYKGEKRTESVPVEQKVHGVLYLSFELIVKNLNDDQKSIIGMLDHRCQIPYDSTLTDNTVQYKNPFEVYCIRKQESFGDDLFSVITGTREKITEVNDKSSWDDLDYHMMRSTWKGNSTEAICESLPMTLTYAEKIEEVSKIQDELYQPSGSSHQTLDPLAIPLLEMKKMKLGKWDESLTIRYQKSVKAPPRSHKAIKASRTFTCLQIRPSQDLIENLWKFRTGNTFLGEFRMRNETLGNWKKVTGDQLFSEDTVECELPSIDRSQLSNFAGREIYETNKNFMTTHMKKFLSKDGIPERAEFWMVLSIPISVKMPDETQEETAPIEIMEEPEEDYDDFMNSIADYEPTSILETMKRKIIDINSAVESGDIEDNRMEIHEEYDREELQTMFSDEETTDAIRFSDTGEGLLKTREIRVKVTSDISVVLNNYFKKASMTNMIFYQLMEMNAVFGLSSPMMTRNIDWDLRNTPGFMFYTVDKMMRDKIDKIISDEVIEPVRYDTLLSEDYVDYLRSLEKPDAIFDGRRYLQAEKLCEYNPLVTFKSNKTGIEVDMDTFIKKYIETVEHWKKINSHLNL